MGPPQPARGGINIEACARPIAVDHCISLPYYFRIAGSLLRQANIYRNEKNLLDLYVILLRYSSLLCETIPKHRDYFAFKSREKEFFTKLIDVLNELESLKPVVQRQIAEHNRGCTVESNNVNGTYAPTRRIEQHNPSFYTTQPFARSANGSSQKSLLVGRHQVAPLPSVQPDRQFRKQFTNLPYPKEETLARHSILGPNGLHGQWNGPVAGIKVQYPSNVELTQSDITSLVPAILDQDGLHGPSTTHPDSSTNDSEDMKSVLSLDDGRWSVQAEERIPLPPVSLEEELSQLIIKQPSPPPVLAEVQRPISPSRVADLTPGIPTSEIGRFHDLHFPVKLMECFLRVAEANTKRSLETCGVLAGTLKKRTFCVTTLIIPKQKSTSNTCEATNEEELFEVQDMGSLFTLGWIHTHPTQSCFLSSIDLHNHYSYQVMLPEAIAIVMAPTDTTRKHGIFHLTDPGGMGVIHDCAERGFHPHKAPLDGSPIYESCSHVYMDADVQFDMIDLRER
ncbi:AMSH-like ubiquitin thioesterase 3 isoform X2 [Phragmites australis]|uniref:AMSH-like ubiquitin thioesterase 3 isoform X2 n=1 Tax=Phragmites australis TaxID=29695 RepID=UPI002D786762|nr:AMSH-like ubiquitin thioesterase 3 isoform X2 [Phragmites australis]